jgi:hypothetical protein
MVPAGAKATLPFATKANALWPFCASVAPSLTTAKSPAICSAVW